MVDEGRFIRHRDITDSSGRPLRLYDDGCRIYGIWTSKLPINGPDEPELIMEYKHCRFGDMAHAAIDTLMEGVVHKP